VSLLVERIQPEKVILFGSYANGTPNSDSDVDVLVIMPFEGKAALMATEIMNMVNHPGYPVDLIVRTPEQISDRLDKDDFFIRDVIERGKVFYEASYT
jgi:predicted nucleotidyltransferase